MTQQDQINAKAEQDVVDGWFSVQDFTANFQAAVSNWFNVYSTLVLEIPT